MAARLYPTPLGQSGIVDLRRVTPYDLDPLLEEEIAAWRDELEWDFRKSAELVRRFVDLRALHGAALLEGGEVAGYAYYVLEDNKGLIGDVYVRRAFRGAEKEDLLLAKAVGEITANPSVARIEAQVMMLARRPAGRMPTPDRVTAFERDFMRLELSEADLGEGRVRRPCYIENWSDFYQDAAAQLIAEAYSGHVDARINDQYRSPAGARRFLHNIVQYPGCGSFSRPASFAAFDGVGEKICGVCLASMVAPECGHITQICVSDSARGTGIGHALLRRSLLAFRNMGCRAVSLTVTASNREAVALYERVGFRTPRKFSAYVWDGF